MDEENIPPGLGSPFSAADHQTTTHHRWKDLILEHLDTYCSDLERDLPELVTAKLRGRIAELNDLLALASASTRNDQRSVIE